MKICILWLIPVVLGSATRYFLQVSDVHADMHYQEGSPATCFLGSTGIGCCRAFDIPIPPYRRTDKWGDFNCDSPLLLVNRSLEWAAQNLNLSFVIWTGDTVGHHLFHETLADNRETLQVVNDMFRFHFPKIPVYPALGNHDTFVDQEEPGFTFPRIANMWKEWLDPVATESVLQFGYYYQDVPETNIRIVSINSLLYDRYNLFLYIKHHGQDIGEQDPAGQWKWLEETLRQSSNKTVFIIGHIPVGTNEAGFHFSERFQGLLSTPMNRNHSFSFWGHTHYDSFKILRDSDGIPFHTSFVMSSLMPDHHFPTMRVYEYDSDSFELLDYHQYVLNLTRLKETNEFHYEVLYTASKVYDLSKGFTPQSWARLGENLLSNSTLFHRYFDNYYAGAGFLQTPCDSACQQEMIQEILFPVPSPNGLFLT